MATNATYTVYVDGIFDLPHRGHLNFLQKAYDKGIELFQEKKVDGSFRFLIGVCDAGVSDYKREPIMTLEERCQAIRNMILGKIEAEVLWDAVPISLTAEFIQRYKIDLVVHGDDFAPELIEKYYGVAMAHSQFVTVPYSHGISTTEITNRAKIENELCIDCEHLPVTADVLVKRIQSR